MTVGDLAREQAQEGPFTTRQLLRLEPTSDPLANLPELVPTPLAALV